MNLFERMGRIGWIVGGLALLFVVATMFATVEATAADSTPATINFQGRLTTAAGVPVEGIKDMYFRYYDAATVGNLLYAESRTFANGNEVTVTQGNYAVALGSGTRVAPPNQGSAADFRAMFGASAAVWLELQVSGEAVMTPRIRILAAGYAINADLLDGKDGVWYQDASNLNAGTVNAARLPADGYAATYVNVTGDTMTGALTVGGVIESTSGGFKFPDASVQQFSGKVINVTYRQNTTRVVLAVGSSISLESFTVDKKSATSNLVVQGSVAGFGDHAGSGNLAWTYGAGAEVIGQNLMYSASSSLHGRTFPTSVVITGHTTTGPQTLSFRYFTQDGSGTNKPFVTYNPNTTDDVRLGQTRSVYVVWEVEP